MGKIKDLIKRGFRKLRLFGRVGKMNRQVDRFSNPDQDQGAVLYFNASARLEGMNLNAAFQLLSSWGVQLAGCRVIHFSCRSGMSQCVLGAGLGDPHQPPPCQGCIRHSRLFTGAAETYWFDYQEDPGLRDILEQSSLAELHNFEYRGCPLGKLVLPSLRWILRRHNLIDDPTTLYLFREYILSAHNIAKNITEVLNEVDPDVVVVFNGLQYPEAVVRWAAHQKKIRVVTHEVNLQPFSAFFTDGQATIYPLEIPDDFQLLPSQNQRLDDYLSRRFQGDFKMAGVKFWEDMNQLSQEFVDFTNSFKGMIPVFTNVVFDTSQAHANTLFADMFKWLDLIHKTALEHKEYLFVIRAHPDEMRAGKSSRESVLEWAEGKKIPQLSNVYLIGPDETLSSYELIQRSKFTMVYNSSIGLEASLLGKPVLCAGRARYTQYPTVFFPDSREDYQDKLKEFLEADQIEVPSRHQEYARKFLYYQLYLASLSFDEFLMDHPTPGYIQLKRFSWKDLLPGSSPVIDRVVSGILAGEDFILENDV
jgi:hypothetical protein